MLVAKPSAHSRRIAFCDQAGPDLTGIGDKPASLLDFGVRDDLPRRLPGRTLSERKVRNIVAFIRTLEPTGK